MGQGWLDQRADIEGTVNYVELSRNKSTTHTVGWEIVPP